ncbi:MAG: branched-chain amino acid ABC transporter permease [Burkholderiales bacterium]
MNDTSLPRGFVAALVAVAIAVPWLVPSFVLFQLTLVLVYAIAILGLNLLTGFNGQVSLGHSAFFALGAYAAAIGIDQVHLPYYATLPVAAVVCFVVGFLFGLPALRLQGSYLALATFALAVAMPQILKFSRLETWTGGVQGISFNKPEPPAGLSLNADQWLYAVVFGVALLAFAGAKRLVASRSGRALMAIRDNPVAATAMGVDVALVKSLTFGVSALYTGVAGALAAIVLQYVAPDSYTVLFSIALLVGLVVGGVGSIPGALLGGLFILFVPNLAEKVSKSLAGGIYALILLLVIYLMPTGIAGALGRLRAWRQRAHNKGD